MSWLQCRRDFVVHVGVSDSQGVVQVTLSGAKKPSHGGVPSWFKGNGPAQEVSTPLQLEGNRRMLRRQKAHHHSVEDEWLKVHRCGACALQPRNGSITLCLSGHRCRLL